MALQIQCPNCGGWARYEGYVSFPKQTIYRCDECGKVNWREQQPPPYIGIAGQTGQNQRNRSGE